MHYASRICRPRFLATPRCSHHTLTIRPVYPWVATLRMDVRDSALRPYIRRAHINPSDSTYAATCLNALCLPHRMAFRVERKSPPCLGIFDFIFHLAVGYRLITHDAEVSRSISCSDLPRSYARQSAVLNALAHVDSQRSVW